MVVVRVLCIRQSNRCHLFIKGAYENEVLGWMHRWYLNFDSVFYDVFNDIFVPEGFTNLMSLPMILTLAMVLTLFSVATYFDHKLFHTDDHNKIDFHWLTYYMLGIFGYLDLEGNRLTFKSQVWFNPCACCKCPRQLKLCDDRTQNMNTWWSFLSIFILSLGVSLLFGSGVNHPQVCLFNALAETEQLRQLNDIDFLNLLFNQTNDFVTTSDAGDTFPTLKFDGPSFASEILILLFSKSQDLLLYNLARAGYMTQRSALFMTFVIAACFSGGAAWYTWEDFHTDTLLVDWCTGFMTAIVLVPIFCAIFYGLAAVMVKCACLHIPPANVEYEQGNVMRTFPIAPPSHPATPQATAAEEVVLQPTLVCTY